MQAGKLDRKIVIKTPTVSKDTWGGATTTWAILATVWANVDYSMGESMNRLYGSTSKRINVMDSAMFTIRYRSDIDMEQRIYYRDQEYVIEGIQEAEGRDNFLKILASRVRNH